MIRYLFSGAVVLGLMLLAPQVYADVPTLQFQVDNGVIVSCEDGATCDLGNFPGDGVVTFSGALGGVYGVNVTTGVTKPYLAGSQMDLNSINIQSLTGGAHTLRMMFSATDFWLLNVGGVASFGGTNNGTTVSYQTYFDTNNTRFSLGTLIGESGVQAGRAYSGTYSGLGPSAAPYSMTQVVTLTSSGPGSLFSGDFAIQMVPTSVPEPASVVELLGVGLLATFGAMRRKSHLS